MLKSNLVLKLEDFDLIVYDFDGVMTDNRVFIDQNGKESVFCNRADGFAISRINKSRTKQIIISTEENKVVSARAKKLKIPVIHGVKDKKTILSQYCRKNNIKLAKVIYIGNDINDLEAMRLAKLKICPSDANRKIKSIANLITRAKGGGGVIREVFEIFK